MKQKNPLLKFVCVRYGLTINLQNHIARLNSGSRNRAAVGHGYHNQALVGLQL